MKKIKILLIEDETILALHIKSCLERFNCEVVGIAKDASNAYSIADNNLIDIVFSDINLDGDIDGIEVSEVLQKKYQIPIIFITAYKDQETLFRASKVDFVGYLLKPFREDELEALLHLTIAKYNLESELIQISKTLSFDKTNQALFYINESIELSKKEKTLLLLLINSINVLVSNSVIDEIIWKGEFVSDNTRRQLLHRLKTKLLDANIQSVKGLGIILKI